MPSPGTHSMYYGSLPRTRPSPCENTPIGETAILAGPLKSKCHRHRGRPDRPYCGELVQRDPIRFPIWQTDGNMSLALVQMLYNVTCHDWGWETTPKGQDYGTRFDRNILSSCTRFRRSEPVVFGKKGSAAPLTGNRSTDDVHTVRST